MKVVIDTNLLVSSISKRSEFRWVFEEFINEKFILCVTTEILAEYEEILQQFFGFDLASIVLQIIENAINVDLITTYYTWQLIEVDPDDNKFVDCAIASGANYLVSHDKHFNVLKNIPFPKVKVISGKQFQKVLGKSDFH